jgi:IS1 family transposase
MLERSSILPHMNRLNVAERAKILSCLVEGNSIRATCRMTGRDKGAVIKLLEDVGTACREYHDKHVRNVKATRVQCDEIWSFCYAKAKNLPDDYKGVFGFGDVWTWTALDADSKLMVAYSVAGRDAISANNFVRDLAGRLANRVQLTTDAYRMYLVAVDEAFGGYIDYAMLDKIYSTPKGMESAARYSPGVCCGTVTRKISGNPRKQDISTSHVERQNLTMRMSMRRFTRLTNGFSKKVENLAFAVALHFMHYNFCRIHQTLRVTPAMQAGLTDHVWTLQEIAALADPATVASVDTQVVVG